MGHCCGEMLDVTMRAVLRCRQGVNIADVRAAGLQNADVANGCRMCPGGVVESSRVRNRIPIDHSVSNRCKHLLRECRLRQWALRAVIVAIACAFRCHVRASACGREAQFAAAIFSDQM
jgi:hypothetical protein